MRFYISKPTTAILATSKNATLTPFRYERNGKQFSMSYNEAPGEVLDDPDEMTHWAIQAIAAAKKNKK